MITPVYFVSYACAETLENDIKEFETYSEAFEFYQRYKMSGYSVAMHEVTSDALLEELRKKAA